MRKVGLLIIAVLSFTISRAQYTVISDDSTYVPTSANALLEIHSATGNKGILVPRLTTVQRTALTIVAPADNSLLVYDTDTKTFWYFDGTVWVEIVPGGTDDQYLTLSNDTLYIENGNNIYLGGYNQTLSFDNVTNQLTISNGNTVTIPDSVNDADSDPTNEIELPATAVNGQVLTWNGTAWVAQNPGAGADNWGSQVVVSDATLTGDGTAGNPLSVNGDLTDDQNISGSGLSGTTLTIGIENGTSETVDLSSLQDGTGTDNQTLSLSGNNLSISSGNTVDLSGFMDNTDNQTLSLGGNTLSISGGNSVDLSSFGNDWKLTGNAGTTAGTNFLGTTDNVSLSFKTNNAERLRITNTGFVGIGTTSPASMLQVNGGTRIIYSTSPTLYLQNDANSSSNYALQIYSQGSVRSWIASNGRAYFADRVGIGTSSPTEALDVSGNIKMSGALMPNNNAGTNGQILTSQGPGAPPIWEAPASIPLYGNNATSVELSNLVTTTNTSAWEDITGMTLTFTPEHSYFYIFSSLCARLADNSGLAQFGQAMIQVRVLVNGVEVAKAATVLTDYDDLNGVLTSGTVSFSGVRALGTIGSSTIVKLQWKPVILWANLPWRVEINPGLSGVADHCVLTIFD